MQQKKFPRCVEEFNNLRENVCIDKWQFGNTVAFMDLYIYIYVYIYICAKSIVKEYKEKDDFTSTEEAASAILEMSTHLDKLEERIERHIKVDVDPAIAHEKVLILHSPKCGK